MKDRREDWHGQGSVSGLGVMGYPMAGHLQKAGHEVTWETVYNRTTAKAEKWAGEYGGAFQGDAAARLPRARISSWPASATTTTCGRSALWR